MGTDEDYLDSLLKAATEPNENGDAASGSDNMYNPLLMDEKQMEEIDELLGLTYNAGDDFENDNDNDSESDADSNVDGDGGSEQLFKDMKPAGSEGEKVPLDAAPVMTEESSILDAESDFSGMGTGLGDILDGFGDDDELAEISELLKKSDNNEFVDEDNELLALFEGTDNKSVEKTENNSTDNGENNENGEENPKKKKRERKKKPEKVKKAKKADENQSEDVDSKDKKEGGGFFAKLFAALTEEEEEPEDTNLSNGEGAQQESEQSAPKKKDKKAKKKKGKKGAETNEQILEEMNAEDAAAKKAKKKKPKKEKKPKEEGTAVVEEKGKKIPRKMIIRVGVLCFSIMIVIILPALFLPQILQKSKARNDFYAGNYQDAYEGLVGFELNDSDGIILRKAELLSQLDRKERSYEAYRLAGEKEKALNALIEGAAYYQDNLEEIINLGIQDDALTAYGKLLVLLQNEYSLNEAQVVEIIALDKVDYTYRIKELTGSGVGTSQQGEALTDEENDGQNGNADEDLQSADAQEENPAQEDVIMPEPLEDQLDEEAD